MRHRRLILFLSAMLLAIHAGEAFAAEIGTDWVQLQGGSGRITLATDASDWQIGADVYARLSEGITSSGIDVWVRRYEGARWVGVSVGYRNEMAAFSVAHLVMGYRLQNSEAFIEPAIALQYRSNEFVGLVPKLYVGLRL